MAKKKNGRVVLQAVWCCCGGKLGEISNKEIRACNYASRVAYIQLPTTQANCDF
jgi:hypothetical protein